MGDIVNFLVTESRMEGVNLPPQYPPQGIFGFKNHFLKRLKVYRCWKCRTTSSNDVLFTAGFSM